MRPTFVTLLLVLGWTAPALAAPARMIAADDRGVTFELTVPAFRVVPTEDGAASLEVPGLQAMDVPGRAAMPVASVLLAVPPGARAMARILGGDPEQVRDDVRLQIIGRPFFRPGDDAKELVPAREAVPAIQDGAWPRGLVEVGEPFALRRQRLVAVKIMPFRYDPTLGRLWSRKSITVRVDFSGGGAAPASPLGGGREDGSWEAVFREAVLNYSQARDWRLPAHPATRRGAFDLAPPGAAISARGLAAAAFDEDNPEVRVKVDTSGVYQLSYALLSANGYPSGVPISEVSVHRHEFVENTSPPYVTIELPIEILDVDGN